MLDAKVFSCNMWLFQKVRVKNGRLWAGHVCAHPSVQGLPRQGPQLNPWQVGLSQGWLLGNPKKLFHLGSVEMFQSGFILALLIIAVQTPIYI